MSHSSLSRRDFLALLGASSATLALGGHSALAAEGRKPNVIVILADDQGYAELGCQGSKDVPTPNIDTIAKSGVRFTNGYVSCPVCSPSRAGLMTGRYQQRFGHEFNGGPPELCPPNFGLPLSETTIASRMKSAGYATGMVGKWHLGHREGYRPRDRGFDEFFGFLAGWHAYIGSDAGIELSILRGNEIVQEKEYLTDAFAREAKAFINKNAKKPFFLYLAFNAVHDPMQTTPKYRERFMHIQDKKRRNFAGMLSAMDDAVGEVLAEVRKHDLENDTLIIYLSDNGGPTTQTTSSNAPLRGVKGEVYEGGVRIPLLMQWKGKLPAGKVYDKPVISLDIAPTALAAAGATVKDAKFDGVNLLPFLKSDGTPHEALYWRLGNVSGIRKGDWKLDKMPKQKAELYNLAEDKAEANNLADKHPEKLRELQDAYDKWNSQLVDHLWTYCGKPIPPE